MPCPHTWSFHRGPWLCPSLRGLHRGLVFYFQLHTWHVHRAKRSPLSASKCWNIISLVTPLVNIISWWTSLLAPSSRQQGVFKVIVLPTIDVLSYNGASLSGVWELWISWFRRSAVDHRSGKQKIVTQWTWLCGREWLVDRWGTWEWACAGCLCRVPQRTRHDRWMTNYFGDPLLCLSHAYSRDVWTHVCEICADTCTCTNMSCERCVCVHLPIGCREVLSPGQPKLS